MNFFKRFFILLLICSGPAMAQDVLLEQDVNKDTIIPRKGPNYRHYTHLYMGYGAVVGNGATGAELKTGNSGQFVFGSRYKLKLTNFYALGLDFSYNVTGYAIKQSNLKILPNKSLHDKENINLNCLSLGFYNRFNFGKRGNSIGNFLDIGAYGDWVFAANHEYVDNYSTANSVYAKKTKVKNTRLQYVNSINYGLNARIGLGRYIAFGQYRLSDLFESSYLYPELPKLIIGLQIGFY